MGCWWEAVSPLCLFFRLALGGNEGAERFRGVQPVHQVGQDACETHVVLWGRLGQRGEVYVCLTSEPDARTLVRANGEWSRDDSWIFDGNGLEEGQDVIKIVCGGGQRLGGGLLFLKWLHRLCILGLDGDDAIVVVGLVCLACGFLFLHPLHDGAGKNLQELACVRLPVEDRDLHEKLREEDGVAQSPVPLLPRSREAAVGGAKEDFCDRETDLVAVCGKGDLDLQGNYRR